MRAQMAPDIYQLLLDISLNYYCVTCGALWPPLCQCMVTLYWHSDVLLPAFCNLLLSVHTIGCIQAASSLNTYVTYHQIVFYDSCSRNRRDPEIGHCMLSKWHMHMQRWLGCHATSPTTHNLPHHTILPPYYSLIWTSIIMDSRTAARGAWFQKQE
jgi:hypothetical protein